MNPNPLEVQRILDPPWSRWVHRLLMPVFVLLFIGLLPWMWSMATGYLFDWRTLGFEKTAVLVLETSPSGAAIALNDRPLEQTTPATLERLRPGRYRIHVALPGYYAWSRTVTLGGGEARQFATILLIPTQPTLTQLFDEAITDFWMEKDGTVFVRLSEGGAIETVRVYTAEEFLTNPRRPAIEGMTLEKQAPDGTAILRWQPERVWVVGYDKNPWRRWELAGKETVIYQGSHAVLNAFWHRDSRNIIVVTSGQVYVVAIDDGVVTAPVPVQQLTRPLPYTYYDAHRDWLFFAEALSPWKANEWVLKRLELIATPSREGNAHGR